MKFRFYLVFGLLVILFIQPSSSTAQETIQTKQQDYYGLNSREWQSISKRYKKTQPRADISLLNGQTISGQLLLARDSNLVIFPGYEIVMEPVMSERFKIIAFTDIENVTVIRKPKANIGMITGAIVGGAPGFIVGAGLGYATGSAALALVPFAGGIAGGGLIGNKLQKLKTRKIISSSEDGSQKASKINTIKDWAVFQDSITFPGDFRELEKNSGALQYSFPDTRFKFTAAGDIGKIGIEASSNLEDSFPSSNPETRTYKPEHKLSIHSFGIAYKLNDHFYIGGEWFYNRSRSSIQYNLYDSLSYDIDIGRFSGVKLYSEYTPFITDKYSNTNIEILFGAGIILVSYEHYVEWQYSNDYKDASNSGYIATKQKLIGFNPRVSLNIYPTKWLSFSIGCEGYIFGSASISEVNKLIPYNDSYPPFNITIPEYKIKHNAIKMTIGTHIYF